MRYLDALVDFLLLVQGRTIGWVDALLELLGRLFDALLRWCRRRRLPGRLGKTPVSRCVPLSDPAYARPDPLIYDQYHLMQAGLAVTWDNPDIQLWRDGVPVPSEDVLPDTDYQVVARIWNGSTQAPVVDLPVDFSYLSFGIGTTSHPIGSTTVDLGVKGGPQHPAYASTTWHTPREGGHYCVQVGFTWVDDVNPNNNLGQENVQVLTAHSPAAGTFTLRNDRDEPARYRFRVDTYVPPRRPPCGEAGPRRPDPGRYRARRSPDAVDVVPEGHDRAAHPLPAGWAVGFDPETPSLAPGAETPVRVTVTPPPGFAGTQAVNVNAFNDRGLAGGVTLRVVA